MQVVDAIVVWGSLDDIVARVKTHLDAGADHVAVQVLPADPRGPADGRVARTGVGHLVAVTASRPWRASTSWPPSRRDGGAFADVVRGGRHRRTRSLVPRSGPWPT